MNRFFKIVLTSTRRASTNGSGKRKTPFEGDKVHIPDEPYNSKIDESLLSEMPPIDAKLISHLERLSLVRFDSEQAVANLRNSIRMAKRLELVDVEDIEPMHTVWESQECPTFDDVEEEPLPIDKVFRNAAVRFDDFFVTPPGNVPLESNERFDLNVINKWDTIGKPVSPEAKTIRLVEGRRK
ncbi:hypothetical protein GCK72_010243 [Caenorhabditis remanei]|uniref:Glutamyl-tRNA(Gln) amidotransferase subunit C, mitochondrial n=1 Tax=Caenorhabditis remanei TaxID=31234 RepID=A0A2P4VA25_CAERE|nr:hypothetical protein GCK72_010243 [Caenorhabditis remanei]KAF1761983.1 hypothetical protein GCK72_010243 [Caenorhabditis remanei]